MSKTPEYKNSDDLENFFINLIFLLLGPPREKIEFFSLSAMCTIDSLLEKPLEESFS
jgi:hypothetical protein